MKRIGFLCLMVLVLLGISSVASANKFSIGAFAGMNIPLVQKDVGNGTAFGAKGRIMVLPFLGVEPNFVISKDGDKDHDVGGVTMTRKGIDFTSFGLDAVFGTFSGFSKAHFYGIFGLNTNTFKRDGIPDQTRLGLAIGTGFEYLPADILGVEVRVRVHNISLKGEGEETMRS